LAEAGQMFLAAGRWGEALECLKAVDDRAGLQELKARALEAGDFFYAGQAAGALDETLSPQELAILAEKAQAAGKQAFFKAASETAREIEDDNK
jgi:hypothetical protein